MRTSCRQRPPSVGGVGTTNERKSTFIEGVEHTAARSSMHESWLIGPSVGERQRVQIARALAGRPRVLMLDEATANLDYATENDIRHALLQATHRPTTLVIAHRY